MRKVLLTILATAFTTFGASAQIEFTEFLIDDYSTGTASLYAIDMDGDEDMDLLGAFSVQSQIVYWQNWGGDPINWTMEVIDPFFWGAKSVHAADLEGDGDIDVFGAATSGALISVFRNDGGDPTVWTEQIIKSGYLYSHEVWAVDFDFDGDADVFGAASDLNEITYWRNDGGVPVVWNEQVVDSDFMMAKSVATADIDLDGDLDVVGAALLSNDINWWRNDGGDPIHWTEFTLDYNFSGAHRVFLTDMDHDLDVDVVGSGWYAGQVAWWRNDGGDPVEWTKQIIGTGVTRTCQSMAADIDGDGDMDVAATGQESDEVSWWRNDGGDPIVWTKFYIDENLDRVWPLWICDIDDDEDQDVIAASGYNSTANEVRYYRNDGVMGTEAEVRANAPLSFKFGGIHPNPFNPVTVISYSLPNRCDVRMTVYDLRGQVIARLADGQRDAGNHEVAFDASGLSSGLYLCQFVAGKSIATQKMLLLK